VPKSLLVFQGHRSVELANSGEDDVYDNNNNSSTNS
jgi:hypothetical protein